MKSFSFVQILAVLTGTLLAGCDKSAETPRPEPAPAEAKAQASAAPAPSTGPVTAKEVPPAAGSVSAKPGGKEMACAPGGCAPGKCGGKKE
jgi:hypothetical protein